MQTDIDKIMNDQKQDSLKKDWLKRHLNTIT